MKAVYPVFIKGSEDMQLVYIPDIDVNTQGYDFYDAIEMARDALGLALTLREDLGETLPEPSDVKAARAKAKADADEIFDYSDGILTFVDVDTVKYRKNNRSVRKNCTIPYWLNQM